MERRRTTRADESRPDDDAPRDRFGERANGRGWERELPPPPPPRRGPDLSALFVLLDALRRAVPRELEQHFTALLRELLLTLRSLIDWYLDRLDGGRREPEVEDIPID